MLSRGQLDVEAVFHLQHPYDEPAEARDLIPSLHRLGYLASDSDILLCVGRGLLFVFGFDDLMIWIYGGCGGYPS
jgi:hypothetical protein